MEVHKDSNLITILLCPSYVQQQPLLSMLFSSLTSSLPESSKLLRYFLLLFARSFFLSLYLLSLTSCIKGPLNIYRSFIFHLKIASESSNFLTHMDCSPHAFKYKLQNGLDDLGSIPGRGHRVQNISGDHPERVPGALPRG